MRILPACLAVLLAACSHAPAPTPATAPAPAAAAGRTAPQWQRVMLGTPGREYPFAVYANHALGGDLTRIRRVVFVQHGGSRNGDEYYAASERTLAANGTDGAQTLLVAPNFFSPPDLEKQPLTGFPVWATGGWPAGEDSIAGPAGISSFQVLDDLLERLTDRRRLPALERVVVAGHSAGGQYVNRYAALNRIDARVRSAGIAIAYVAANPSTWLYFTPERPQDGRFAVPAAAAACPDYDDYRYGFGRLVRYGGGLSAADGLRAYLARDVTVLLGTRDIDPNQSNLDRSCGAATQGAFRLERGRNYVRYLQHAAGGTRPGHRAFEVSGIAHDQKGMFGSACGARLLFGGTGPGPDGGAACTEITPAAWK